MSRLVVETAADRLTFDGASGRLISVRHGASPRTELIAARAGDPVVEVGFLDEARVFRSVDDRTADAVRVRLERADRGAWRLTTSVKGLGGLALDATVTVRGGPADRSARWSVAVDDRTPGRLRLTHVAFPWLALPVRRRMGIVRPFGAGQLLRGDLLDALEPDTPEAFQLRPESFDCLHYPGYTFAQFLASCGASAGLMVMALDASGRPKVIKPLATADGRIRLGFAHLGDPADLDHDVAIGGFVGDWEDAAGLYRDWAMTQPWASRPLAARRDIPAWLLDSPMPVVIRAAGVVDDSGPATPNEAFVPYARSLPALDALAEATGGPLMPILMAWEREGPWVYPEALPPVGGSASFAAFTVAARDRGWHVGTFCDGTRWVVGHAFAGYDGHTHFEAAGGPATTSRTHTDELWQENWDASWRPSYPGCLAVPRTREIALDYVASLAGDLGLDMIQFFDQNLGGCTFPCYADDHPHPSVPGPWMTAAMSAFMADVTTTAARAAGPGRTTAISVESAPAEVHLGSIALCDIRAVVDGHDAADPLWDGAIPLFHFLYHELLPIQGGFGWAPEPHHVALRNAWNIVIGALPGGVLTPSGHLLDRDTVNWAPWDEPVEDPAAGLAVLRSGLALRRGPGREHLVFGRMERTASVDGIETERWTHDGRDHAIPTVVHRAWMAPDGTIGLVAANWTATARAVVVDDPRFVRGGRWTVSAETIRASVVAPGPAALRLPPHACGVFLVTRSGDAHAEPR